MSANVLQPIKASLVDDLVGLINENLGALLQVRVIRCTRCDGTGELVQEESHSDEPNRQTCPECSGVGYVERYQLDQEKLRTQRYGRLIEGFDFKQGQYVPKFRSKDKAFTMLVKLLGFDRAIVEIANGATFNETVSEDQRALVVSQLKELAAMGLLDG